MNDLIDTVKLAAKRAGNLFFEPSRAWQTRLGSAKQSRDPNVIFFVTSEKTFDGKSRRYTVRAAQLHPFVITNKSGFQQFASSSAATRWMEKNCE